MLTEAAYTYFACKGGRNYTTDVKELREMHNLFIKNYNELNKMFNFNNLLQIQTLYYYLYRNGYLSVNPEFTFENKTKTNSVTSILGADVINGQKL